MPPERRFVLLAHTLPPNGAIQFNDLAGSSGRIDVAARAVTSAFLLSHGLRKDTRMTIIVGKGEAYARGSRASEALGAPESGRERAPHAAATASGDRAPSEAPSAGPAPLRKLLHLDGSRLRMLNPDERSTAALLSKALSRDDSGRVWLETTPGISVRHAHLDDALREATAGSHVVLLDETAFGDARKETEAWVTRKAMSFILSDHLDLTQPERDAIAALEPQRATLGPTAYHGHACIAVVHWLLDRAAPAPR